MMSTDNYKWSTVRSSTYGLAISLTYNPGKCGGATPLYGLYSMCVLNTRFGQAQLFWTWDPPPWPPH